MRVMLASGQIVTASETVNNDLWWAMRGGTGGNFGVLLSVRYKLDHQDARTLFLDFVVIGKKTFKHNALRRVHDAFLDDSRLCRPGSSSH